MVKFGSAPNLSRLRSVAKEAGSVKSLVGIYPYPYELKPADKLSDGSLGRPLPITRNTLLVWIDLALNFRFAHPTAYVLISDGESAEDGAEVRVENGRWWPVLNGENILVNQDLVTGLIHTEE
jgi:hypothetical protein